MSPYVWQVRWDEALFTVLLLAAYVLALRFFPAPRRRVACFAAAIALLVLAFQTPLEHVALHYLLSAHLLQNVILAEWAPALAVLGVPAAMAAAIGRAPAVRVLVHPLVALPLWLCTYMVWHLPPVYDAALRRPESLLHLEHLTYFVTGAMLWWPVLQDAPRRLSDGVRAGYLFGAFVLASPIGLLIALVPTAVYDFYLSAPERLFGLSRLEDQQLAGMTMAAEQAIVFFAVFGFYLLRFLAQEELGERRVTSGSP
ncbi:MAG TPA: cytochrome c oxidase assembly protein [Gaiellaceae bacterium]|nr:cytochrome c oxidase assembly protein [Gaiellaceae bacterium]